ncbi:hypothetical protein JW988_02300 [Candidatus Bathyarchaeota archaeon]|nr:hypothetical protein [Candidatus Bathyarchaeota archaeon]
MGSETWAMILVAVALLIKLVVIATRKDVAYSLVLVLTSVGIAVNQKVVTAIS